MEILVLNLDIKGEVLAKGIQAEPKEEKKGGRRPSRRRGE